MNKKADEYREKGSEGVGLSLRKLKTFDSFKNPTYRIYYGAMAGQWIAMSMQMVARPLLAYRITHSGTILGLLSLCHAMPLFILSLLGGAIADRVQKKNILVTGQAASAVITLGIAFALALGFLNEERPESWWLLAVSSILQGVVMGFMMPSRSAIIPEIVGEEQLMNAISLNNVGMNTFRLLSPALAGFLVDAIDFDSVYYLMTGMFVMGTIFAICLPHTSTITAHTSSTTSDIVEGMHYIRHDKTILIILVFSLLGIILGTPFIFLMPMFTEDILNVGATGLGLLMMVCGLGSIIVSFFLASLPNKQRGLLLILSTLLMGLTLAGFSFSHWWYLSLVLMAFVGLGQTGQMALSITLTQYYVDASYRGRVISFLMMGIGLGSLGTFFGGILAEAVGVQWSVGGFSIAMALISILALAFTPSLRKMD